MGIKKCMFAQMYRVCWKNYDISGHGDYLPRAIAESWADGMNKRYGKELVHWIEKEHGIKRLLTWTTDDLHKAIRS